MSAPQRSLAEPRNGRVALSTAIPYEQWNEAIANNWKWNDLILTGIQAKKGMEKILNRISSLEEDSIKATQKIRDLAMKNNELNAEIFRMQKEQVKK